MSTITLEAEVRQAMGKGASRRLRRLENKIPAIVYGGGKQAESIHLMHNKVLHALSHENFYSSVIQLNLNGKTQQVILKALQRHPYKPVVLHLDLQRVSAKDTLVKWIPIHFINEDLCSGVKEGGVVNHAMTQVEVRCQVKDLPEYITLDLATLALNDVLHMSDIQLPKGVHFALDPKEGDHDHPVVSVHLPRVAPIEEEVVAEEEDVAGEESVPETQAAPDQAGTEQASPSADDENKSK